MGRPLTPPGLGLGQEKTGNLREPKDGSQAEPYPRGIGAAANLLDFCNKGQHKYPTSLSFIPPLTSRLPPLHLTEPGRTDRTAFQEEWRGNRKSANPPSFQVTVYLLFSLYRTLHNHLPLFYPFIVCLPPPLPSSLEGSYLEGTDFDVFYFSFLFHLWVPRANPSA